jgi:uncharacterized Zn finger protein
MGGRRCMTSQFSARYGLRAILEGFAKREGDIEAGIAIRSKDLCTAYAYLEIAQLCLDHGREAEALKWAEDGLWQFEDHPDERLVLFTADQYCRKGRKEDADKLLWKTFEQLPSIGLYRMLKAAAGRYPAAITVRDRAVALLQQKLGQPEAPARGSSIKEVLLDLLISEELFAEAWKVVRQGGCSDRTLATLAKASEQSHPVEVVTAYAAAVERLVRRGGQSNYADAVKTLRRMQATRKRLGADADHAAYLADLMSRHKTKRNFMKLLEANSSS